MNIQHEIGDTLTGMNWGDDSLFFTHSFTDETSQFDDHPTVKFCGDYYSREYKVRIPIAFRESEDMTERFIELMIDNYPAVRGFWVS